MAANQDVSEKRNGCEGMATYMAGSRKPCEMGRRQVRQKTKTVLDENGRNGPNNYKQRKASDTLDADSGTTGGGETNAMTTLYRVQDSKGRGPWRPGMGLLWIEDRPDHDNLKSLLEEWPDILRKLTRGRHFGCGCRTIEQLRRWFTHGEMATLKGYGYAAVIVVAERIVAESDVQVVFEQSQPLWVGARPFDLWPIKMELAGKEME